MYAQPNGGGSQVLGLRIPSLLFADDVVLLVSMNSDLQLALGRFVAECEAAGVRISTSKFEAMLLRRKRVDYPLWIGATSAVVRTLKRSVVVKTELSQKAKLSFYRSFYYPPPTELWVVTERDHEYKRRK